MKQDRLLLIIGILLVVLVVASIALFFIRQSDVEYGPEDTPGGVVRNYVIALQRSDFSRAYSYLLEDMDKPTYDDFREYFVYWEHSIDEVGVQIGEAHLSQDEAIVELVLIHGGAGLMRDVWRQEASAILINQDGVWRIKNMPSPFFQWEWFGNDNYPGRIPANEGIGQEV